MAATQEELVAEAERLAAAVGEGPDELEWTPRASAWSDQYEAAGQSLGELAEWDYDTLHAAAGPPYDDETPLGPRLLH